MSPNDQNKKGMDLFSPERLRENWARKGGSHTMLMEEDPEAPPSDAASSFSHLQMLIRHRFSGDNREVLDLQLKKLEALMADDSIENRNMEIQSILDTIEDLVFAFGLKVEKPL